MKLLLLISFLFITIVIQGCASGPRTTRVAIDEEQILDANLKANDLRTTVNKMARSLAACKALNKRILAENRLKQNGTVTGRAGQLAGADFLLSGYLFEDRQVGTNNRTSYYRLSFRLTDVASGAVVWEDDYELKRIE